MKRFLKWISNIFSTLLIILLACAVLIVISHRAAGGEPSLRGYQVKTVLSGSMEPDIKVGSIIFIKQTEENASFKKGDVITFLTEENILVTHRIIKVENEGQRFITKGDNNDGPDIEPVLAHNVVGKYTGITIPYAGYALHFANSKQGALLLMILPGLCFIGHAIITIWRALRSIEVSNQGQLKEE